MKESFEYYKQIERLLIDFLEKKSINCEDASLENILYYIQANFPKLVSLCRLIRAVTYIEEENRRIEEYKSLLPHIKKKLEEADE